MSEILQIKNFKGINFEYGQWAEGYGNYVMGMDVFGLQDNTSKLSKPGVMQCMRTLVAGTEAAAPNDITDLVTRFAYFPAADSIWGLSNATRLYERTAGVWTLRRSAGDTPAMTNTTGGGGLAAFIGSLWVGSNANLFRQAGAFPGTWTNFNALSSSGINGRPMKVFSNRLYVGNGQYIDSVTTTPTFNLASSSASNTLTLSSELIIRSIEVYRDRLFISADNVGSATTASGTYARIFVWDGISTTYENAFDMLDEPSAPYLIFNQGVLWAVSSRGSTIGGNPIYIFNGSAFDKIMLLPLGIAAGGQSDITVDRSPLSVYRGGILIGSVNSGASSIITNYPDGTNGIGGVWMINRHNVNHPYQAVLAFNPANGTTQTTIGGVFTSGQNIFIGTRNHSSGAFEVWESLNGTDTNTAGLWDSQPIDAGDASRNKMWHAIQVDVESVGASNNLVLSYRTNYTTNAYTTIKTVSSDAVANNIMPIGTMGKVIQLRVQLGSVAGTTSSRLHGITLYYTILN